MLYCCFFLTEQSHTPPHHLLAEPSWKLHSHWLEGTPRRIWEVLLCLHASRENPNNNCYLGRPVNLQLARQTDRHRGASWSCSHTHDKWGNQVSRNRANVEPLFSLILCWFMLDMTQNICMCTHIFGRDRRQSCGFIVWWNFPKHVWVKFFKPSGLKTVTERIKLCSPSVDVCSCLCL